jgi:hypothetical protein
MGFLEAIVLTICVLVGYLLYADIKTEGKLSDMDERIEKLEHQTNEE